MGLHHDQESNTGTAAFLDWIQKSSVRAVAVDDVEAQREFIPMQEVEKYLEEDQNSRLNKILQEVFRLQEPPIYANVIRNKYTAVLCILLELGRGHLISEFTRHETLRDAMLPFNPDDPPEPFHSLTTDDKFCAFFCRRQWKFCSPKFQYPMLNQTFEPDRILPIIGMSKVSQKGNTIRYIVQIHEAYNSLEDKKRQSVS
jgi:hypothetical protein